MSFDATVDGATIKLTDEQDEAVTEWLYANYEFDDDGYDDGPDWADAPDWEDMR